MKEKSSNYEKYTTGNPLARYLNNTFLDTLSFLAHKSGAKKVLDAGCGEGFVIEYLKKNGQAQFMGLDIEADALEVAKEKNPQVSFQQASVYQLPFEDNSFDLVILSEVLEHLEDPSKALEEIKRVSKQYALISVPHEPVWRFGNMARLKYLRSFGNTPGHINHWTRRAFIGLISSHFTIKEIKTPCPWTVALCKVKES